MKKIKVKNLSPKQAWQEFAGSSEEVFLSNFRHEVPEMDIRKMCRIYAKDIPWTYSCDGIFFTTEELKKIEKLLLTHLEGYIESKGGLDKLDLVSEEELERMARRSYEEIVEGLAQNYNLTREEVGQALTRRSRKRQGRGLRGE